MDSVFSNILSGTVIPSSLSGTSIMHDASGCPRILLGCVHFSSFFPHLLSLDNFNWPIFTFINSLFYLLKLPLELSSVFFISVIIHQFQNFCLITFYNFCFLIDFSYLLRGCSLFFSSFFMASLRSLNIFKADDLKSFSNKFCVYVSSGRLSINSVNRPYALVCFHALSFYT